MHSPVTSAPASDKHASTKACQLASGIGVKGGGGEGGDGGGGGKGVGSGGSAAVGSAGSAAAGSAGSAGSAAVGSVDSAVGSADSAAADSAAGKKYPPLLLARQTPLANPRFPLSGPRSTPPHLWSNSPFSQISSPIVRQLRLCLRLSPRTTSLDTELAPKTATPISSSRGAC